MYFLLAPILTCITGIWLVTMTSLDSGLAQVGFPGPCAYGYCNNILPFRPHSDATAYRPSVVEFPILQTVTIPPFPPSQPRVIALTEPLHSIPTSDRRHPQPPINRQHIHIPDFAPVIRSTFGRINPPPTPWMLFQNAPLTHRRLPTVKIYNGPKKAKFDGFMGDHIVLLASHLVSSGNLPVFAAGVVTALVLIPFAGSFKQRKPQYSWRTANIEDLLKDARVQAGSSEPANRSALWSFPSMQQILRLTTRVFAAIVTSSYPLNEVRCNIIAALFEKRRSAGNLDENLDGESEIFLALSFLLMSMSFCGLICCYDLRRAFSKFLSRFSAVLSGSDESSVAPIPEDQETELPAAAVKRLQFQINAMKTEYEAREKEQNQAHQMALGRKDHVIRWQTLDLSIKDDELSHEKLLQQSAEQRRQWAIQTSKRLRGEQKSLQKETGIIHAKFEEQSKLLAKAQKDYAEYPNEINLLKSMRDTLLGDLNTALSSKKDLTDKLKSTREELETSKSKEKRTEDRRMEFEMAYESLLSTSESDREQHEKLVADLISTRESDVEQQHLKKHSNKVADLQKQRTRAENAHISTKQQLERAQSELLRRDQVDEFTFQKFTRARNANRKLEHELRKAKTAIVMQTLRRKVLRDTQRRRRLDQMPGVRPSTPSPFAGQSLSESALPEVVGKGKGRASDSNYVVWEVANAEESRQLSVESGTPTPIVSPSTPEFEESQRSPEINRDEAEAASAEQAPQDLVNSTSNPTDVSVLAPEPEVLVQKDESKTEKPKETNIFEGKSFDISGLRLPSSADVAVAPQTPALSLTGANTAPTVPETVEEESPPPKQHEPSPPPADADEAVSNVSEAITTQETLPATDSIDQGLEDKPNDPPFDFRVLKTRAKVSNGDECVSGDNDKNSAMPNDILQEDHFHLARDAEDVDMGDYQPERADDENVEMQDADHDLPAERPTFSEDEEMAGGEPDDSDSQSVEMADHASDMPLHQESAGTEDVEMGLDEDDREILGESSQRNQDAAQMVKYPCNTISGTEDDTPRLEGLYERMIAAGTVIRDDELPAFLNPEVTQVQDDRNTAAPSLGNPFVPSNDPPLVHYTGTAGVAANETNLVHQDGATTVNDDELPGLSSGETNNGVEWDDFPGLEASMTGAMAIEGGDNGFIEQGEASASQNIAAPIQDVEQTSTEQNLPVTQSNQVPEDLTTDPGLTIHLDAESDDGFSEEMNNQDPEVFLPLPESSTLLTSSTHPAFHPLPELFQELISPRSPPASPPMAPLLPELPQDRNSQSAGLGGSIEQGFLPGGFQLSDDEIAIAMRFHEAVARGTSSQESLSVVPPSADDNTASEADHRYRDDDEDGDFVGATHSTVEQIQARPRLKPRIRGAMRRAVVRPFSDVQFNDAGESSAAQVDASRKGPLTSWVDPSLASSPSSSPTMTIHAAVAAAIASSQAAAPNAGQSSSNSFHLPDTEATRNRISEVARQIMAWDNASAPSTAQPPSTLVDPPNSEELPRFDERWRTELLSSSGSVPDTGTTAPTAAATESHRSPLYSPQPLWSSQQQQEQQHQHRQRQLHWQREQQQQQQQAPEQVRLRIQRLLDIIETSEVPPLPNQARGDDGDGNPGDGGE